MVNFAVMFTFHLVLVLLISTHNCCVFGSTSILVLSVREKYLLLKFQTSQIKKKVIYLQLMVRPQNTNQERGVNFKENGYKIFTMLKCCNSVSMGVCNKDIRKNIKLLAFVSGRGMLLTE